MQHNADPRPVFVFVLDRMTGDELTLLGQAARVASRECTQHGDGEVAVRMRKKFHRLSEMAFSQLGKLSVPLAEAFAEAKARK